MNYGLRIITVAAAIFSGFAVINCCFLQLPVYMMISVTILSQMTIMFGICMTTGNALALALVNYKDCIGTASSLFGFFYYILISLFTFGMGILHNGTLLPMPLYFLVLGIFMLVVKKILIDNYGIESIS